MAFNFLRALYRPEESRYRIIADPNAEYGHQSIPLREKVRAELSTRLTVLRAGPRDAVRVRISGPEYFLSPDGKYFLSPETLTVNFHRSTGRFGVLPFSGSSERPDIDIDLDDWGEGTRLVSVRALWLGDEEVDSFRIYKGERIYRFAYTGGILD